MVLSEIACPYCNNIIPAPSVTRENQWGIPARIFTFQRSTSIGTTSYMVTCSMCGSHYQFFDMQDFSWLKSRLVLSNYSIEAFKTIAERCGYPLSTSPSSTDVSSVLDCIFEHIVGVTRPIKKCLHICFDYSGHRIYLDCYEQEQFLSGLNVYVVY